MQLGVAAHSGDLPLLQLCLQRGHKHDINRVTSALSIKRTPLAHAVALPDEKRAEPIARFLIEHGADVNAVADKHGDRALHYCRTPAVVHLLVQAGAAVDAPAQLGGTPLGRAVQMGKVDVVRALLECKADPLLVDAESGPIIATSRDDYDRCLEALANHQVEEMTRTRVTLMTGGFWP